MIKFFIISFKQLKRQKIRTFLTIGGVAVAVAVLISLMGFNRGYQQALTNDVEKMGYQLLITAKGCPYEAATLMLKGGGGLKYMDRKVYDEIVNDPRIEKITPNLIQSVYDPNRNDGEGGIALFLGIEWKSYYALKPWTKFLAPADKPADKPWFSSDDAEEIVMGYEVAEFEQRKVGDKFFMPGVDKVVKVVGILERSGTQDDGIIYMPLKAMYKMFPDTDGKLTGIGIKLKEVEMIPEFEDDYYKIPEIQVISMTQVKGTILSLISSAKVLIMSVALIAIIVAIIGVINTILMSVFERTQEIGIMKAIGASKLDIFKFIWIETIIICTLGGIAGSIIAILGGSGVEILVKKVLPYAPGGQLITIGGDLLLVSFFSALLLGIIAGIYPALRAASMRPIEAIRSGE